MEQVPVSSPGPGIAAFIVEARRRLPKDLAAQVEAALRRDIEPGHSTIGWTPEEA
jgi:hypothetical protein